MISKLQLLLAFCNNDDNIDDMSTTWAWRSPRFLMIRNVSTESHHDRRYHLISLSRPCSPELWTYQGPAVMKTNSAWPDLASIARHIIDLLLMISADQTSTRDKLRISYCQIFHWNIPHLLSHSHILNLIAIGHDAICCNWRANSSVHSAL